jgi:hypothetical protein
VRTVRRQWDDDTVEVTVDGDVRGVVANDVPLLEEPRPSRGCCCSVRSTRGSRSATGRWSWSMRRGARSCGASSAGPGAVLRGTEVIGTWRPRSQGGRLQLRVEVWAGGPLPDGIEEQAERLAAHRGQTFAGFVER